MRVAVLLLLFLLPSPRGAASQTAPYQVNDSTQVRAIRFQFLETQTFEEKTLQALLAHTAQGGWLGLRRALSFVPLIGEVGEHPLNPVELQKDAARLERFYRRNGFPGAAVDYMLARDEAENTVRITFLIDEGPPLLIEAVRVVGPDSQAVAAQLPEDLQEAWQRFERTLEEARGARLSEADLTAMQGQVSEWLQNHGYAFAGATAGQHGQAQAGRAEVEIRAEPGPRVQIGEIRVEGNSLVERSVIERTLAFEEGAWFAQRELVAGQRELVGLQLFRAAQVGVASQPADSVADILVQVREREQRSLSIEPAYMSEGGATLQVQWTHHNFWGGARKLTASGLAQTGVGAFAHLPEVHYEGSISFLQPYFLTRRLNYVVNPFLRYRDDVIDRSLTLGYKLSLLYRLGGSQLGGSRLGGFNVVVLDYLGDRRRIFRYGSGDTDDFLDLLADLVEGARDSLGTRVQRNVVSLSATLGKVDDVVNPRRGFAVRPSAEITVPGLLRSSTIQYGRLGASFTGYLPLPKGIGLVGRVNVGRTFPFASSVPQREDAFQALQKVLNLRDVSYFAGGSSDVRGWLQRMLGPKVPNLQRRIIVQEDPALADTVFFADSYSPLGGLAKVSANAELRIPVPWLGSFSQLLLFLDAGRVWTSDGRFTLQGIEALSPHGEQFFFGTGAGLHLSTPVGPIQLSLGYKLNPSLLDVRDPQQVLEAIVAGRPVGEVPEAPVRRWAVHLTIGQVF